MGPVGMEGVEVRLRDGVQRKGRHGPEALVLEGQELQHLNKHGGRVSAKNILKVCLYKFFRACLARF